MSILVSGAIVMACAVIGLHFLRFWKSSHDRFFLYFAAAFWIQGAEWFYAGLGAASEYGAVPYLARLLAYLLVVAAILQKNLANRPAKPG